MSDETVVPTSEEEKADILFGATMGGGQAGGSFPASATPTSSPSQTPEHIPQAVVSTDDVTSLVEEAGLVANETTETFAKTAMELGLNKDQTSNMVSLHQQANQAAITQQSEAWEAASLEQFSREELSTAAEIAQANLDPKVINMLDESGLGSHPALIGLILDLAGGRR